MKVASFNNVWISTEWAVKRYQKFDLREKGKDWKMCLSVINSTARYYRFMDKTRKVRIKVTLLHYTVLQLTTQDLFSFVVVHGT